MVRDTAACPGNAGYTSDVDAQSATTALGELTSSAHDDLPLDRGALLIAAAFDRELDVDREVAMLDGLAQGARGRVSPDLDPLTAINELNEYLFDHIGFAGNEADYYDPRNSLLHEVLRRRLGIPITLSLVYVEVGRRLGLPLRGVGMPGHFLVRHGDESSLFIDPYYSGVLLSEAECAERLRRISDTVRWDRSFLAPVTNRAFLARMLRNLSAIWVKRNDAENAIASLGLLMAVQPEETGHWRDRGMLFYKLGDRTLALDDLEHYLDAAFSAPDAWYVRRVVEKIRSGEPD